MSYVMHVDVIQSEERGLTQTEWLNSRHAFSFGKYLNMKRLNFGTLCAFNDDIVEPGKGFGMHAHENMEIVTIVLEGSLAHKDSAGNQLVLKSGDIQRMTAGSGIEHAEMNASKKAKVHFLQIWVHPEKRGLEPGYEQKHFAHETLTNTFYPIVTNMKEPEPQAALSIHQDTTFFLGHFEEGQTVQHIPRRKNLGIYLFVIDGAISVGNTKLKQGDSAQITQVDVVKVQTLAQSKLLLIEVSISTL